MHEIACSSHILGWSPLCSFARFTRSASVQFRCWTCRSWQNFLGSSCLVAYRQYHHSILIPHSCFHLAFALHTSITGGHSRCACSSLLSCLCCIYSFDLLPLLCSYPVCISIGSYLVIPCSQSCILVTLWELSCVDAHRKCIILRLFCWTVLLSYIHSQHWWLYLLHIVQLHIVSR